ncbi:MAG: tetratricopeptide repeat protein [Clostridiales bacterium]|nr:tetratricopeptide repeat protein [Clostridiales bacterium]
MIKKRIIIFMLAAAVAGTCVLTGCTSEAQETRQEYKEQGIAQMEEGDYAGAVESFQAALDTSVGTVRAEEIDISYYKGMALYKSGDTDGAIDVFSALIDFDDENWEAYYLRGSVYLACDKEDEALADYEAALELNPDDAQMCINIYNNMNDAGLGDEGQAYLDVVLAMTPKEGADYYYLGEAYYLSGDMGNAKTELISAVADEYYEALLLLGNIYYDEGNDQSALQAFETYIENCPDDSDALIRMGEVAMEDGDYEKALNYFASAVKIMGDDASADLLKDMIAAYEYMGDFQDAYDTATEFLKKYSDADVEREYEFLETRVASAEETYDAGDDSEDTDDAGDESAEDAAEDSEDAGSGTEDSGDTTEDSTEDGEAE